MPGERRTYPPAMEMAAALDRLGGLERSSDGFAQRIHQEVMKGNSTGNTLVDMVVRRSGVYIPEQAELYRPIEGLIEQNVGQLALVMTVEKRKSSRRSLMAGVINDAKPVVEGKRWRIPTERYISRDENGVLAEVQGAIPVDDIISKPEKKGHVSTLGTTLRGETVRVWGPGPPGEGYPSLDDQYTITKSTTLWVADTRVGAVGKKADFKPLIKKLEMTKRD